MGMGLLLLRGPTYSMRAKSLICHALVEVVVDNIRYRNSIYFPDPTPHLEIILKVVLSTQQSPKNFFAKFVITYFDQFRPNSSRFV